MRRALVLLLISAPLAACAGGRQGPAKAQIDAVVLDEGQRRKAAAAAEAGASSADALARVSDGPRAQQPVP